MEAIKQTLIDSIDGMANIAIIGVVGMTIIAIIVLFGFSVSAIVTDEAFKVVSDTSKYSCIVSEIDSDLLLKCLKVK